MTLADILQKGVGMCVCVYIHVCMCMYMWEEAGGAPQVSFTFIFIYLLKKKQFLTLPETCRLGQAGWIVSPRAPPTPGWDYQCVPLYLLILFVLLLLFLLLFLSLWLWVPWLHWLSYHSQPIIGVFVWFVFNNFYLIFPAISLPICPWASNMCWT